MNAKKANAILNSKTRDPYDLSNDEPSGYCHNGANPQQLDPDRPFPEQADDFWMHQVKKKSKGRGEAAKESIP